MTGFGLDEMDRVLPSECLGREDDGSFDLIKIVDSADEDTWPGIKCVNDEEWWLGEIVISHRSSFFTDNWLDLIGEYREISLSPAELHTW